MPIDLLWVAIAVLAYIISVIFGHYAAHSFIKFAWARLVAEGTLDAKDERIKGKEWLSALTGYAERLIVTGLVLVDLNLAAAFIGFWVALKFAGGWQRFKEPDADNRAIFQVAMLGNAISIGWAVIMGSFCNVALRAAGIR